MTPRATTSTDDNASVIAICHDCGLKHPVGDRPMGWITTECPVCESTGYTSKVSTVDVSPHHDMIREELADVTGVGTANLNNLIKHYYSREQLMNASVTELTNVDGIGEQTAKNISKHYHNTS